MSDSENIDRARAYSTNVLKILSVWDEGLAGSEGIVAAVDVLFAVQ